MTLSAEVEVTSVMHTKKKAIMCSLRRIYGLISGVAFLCSLTYVSSSLPTIYEYLLPHSGVLNSPYCMNGTTYKAPVP